MDFDKKITCEPGRTIAEDNRPLFYLNIVRDSRALNDYAIAPYQADSVARQLARAMRLLIAKARGAVLKATTAR